MKKYLTKNETEIEIIKVGFQIEIISRSKSFVMDRDQT